MPRTPKTPEQIQIRRIWEEARSRGLRFSSLEDLNAWWAQAQPVQRTSRPPSFAPAAPARPAGRRNTQPSPRPAAPESAEDASPLAPEE